MAEVPLGGRDDHGARPRRTVHTFRGSLRWLRTWGVLATVLIVSTLAAIFLWRSRADDSDPTRTATPRIEAPKGPPIELRVMSGMIERVEVPVEAPDRVGSVRVPEGTVNDVRVEAEISDGSGLSVTAVAAVTARPGLRRLTLAIGRCAQPDDDPCSVEDSQTQFRPVAVRVIEPGEAIPNGFPQPDPRRWRRTTDGRFTLPAEVDVAVDPDATALEVRRLAERLDAGITGGSVDLGLYRFRVADVDAALAALRAEQTVAAASPTAGAVIRPLGVPADYTGASDDHRWQFSQIGLPEAWADPSLGAPVSSVDVGVIDSGIDTDHPELSAASVGSGSGPPVETDAHGTHVAGLMCGRGDNGGALGVASGCRLHTLDEAGRELDTELGWVLHWLNWLNEPANRQVRVVNMSIATVGTAATEDCSQKSVTAARYESTREAYRRFFSSFDGKDGRRDVLFVTAAGNCPSNVILRVRDTLPGAASANSTNVVSVTATIRAGGGQRQRASYAATDGDLAAPGGDTNSPVWSAWSGPGKVKDGSCAAYAGGTPSPSRDQDGPAYNYCAGTSMAAPLVSGVAVLMLQVNPSLTSERLKRCLRDAARTPVSNASPTVRELDAPSALRCARSGSLGPRPYASRVAVGRAHTCVVASGIQPSPASVDAGGKVMCWGDNTKGQLGRGGTGLEYSTGPVDAGVTDAAYLEAGDDHTCAVLTDRTLRCWGANGDGQLGAGGPDERGPVQPAVSTTTRVTAAGRHTCALLESGQVDCWGSNERGQLGDGTTTGRAAPRPVPGITTATSVNSGARTTCATLDDGTVRCWGGIPRDDTANWLTPTELPALRGTTSTLWSAVPDLDGACAIVGLAVRCTTDGSTATDIRRGLGSAASPPVISSEAHHRCLVTPERKLECWGANSAGQLGNGTTDPATVPIPVRGLPDGTVDGFDVGTSHTCAVISTSTGQQVRCWGSNSRGQLGDGTTDAASTPV